MNVQDIMERTFVTVPEDATYKEVADVLYEQNQHCVFVIDERGELVGFVSEHDLFRVLYPFYGSYYLNAEMYTDHTQREKKIEEIQNHPVKGIMQRDIHSAALDEPIMRAGATMLAKKVRRLPVVEKGKLVGVVTRSQIYRALYEAHLKA